MQKQPAFTFIRLVAQTATGTISAFSFEVMPIGRLATPRQSALNRSVSALMRLGGQARLVRGQLATWAHHILPSRRLGKRDRIDRSKIEGLFEVDPRNAHNTDQWTPEFGSEVGILRGNNPVLESPAQRQESTRLRLHKSGR